MNLTKRNVPFRTPDYHTETARGERVAVERRIDFTTILVVR